MVKLNMSKEKKRIPMIGLRVKTKESRAMQIILTISMKSWMVKVMNKILELTTPIRRNTRQFGQHKELCKSKSTEILSTKDNFKPDLEEIP
jgi:hypothetical protein